jgi:hypothetical protein
LYPKAASAVREARDNMNRVFFADRDLTMHSAFANYDKYAVTMFYDPSRLRR